MPQENPNLWIGALEALTVFSLIALAALITFKKSDWN